MNVIESESLPLINPQYIPKRNSMRSIGKAIPATPQ